MATYNGTNSQNLGKKIFAMAMDTDAQSKSRKRNKTNIYETYGYIQTTLIHHLKKKTTRWILPPTHEANPEDANEPKHLRNPWPTKTSNI